MGVGVCVCVHARGQLWATGGEHSVLSYAFNMFEVKTMCEIVSAVLLILFVCLLSGHTLTVKTLTLCHQPHTSTHRLCQTNRNPPKHPLAIRMLVCDAR